MNRLALAVVAVWVLLVPLVQVWPPAVEEVGLERILAAPQPGAWLGYDELGRPVLDRLMVGAANSFLVSLLVVSVSFCIGVPLGICSAYLGGAWDRVAVLVTDVFLAFPGLLLAIALAGLLGPGIGNAVIALCATGWVGFARLARAQTLSLRQREHVEAARALGVPTPALVRRHVLPMLLATLGVQASYEVAAVAIAESTLSFLGLGVQPPAPSLGGMILEGTRYMLVAPHLVLAPGLTLVVLVLSVNLLGDHLRDRLDRFAA